MTKAQTKGARRRSRAGRPRATEREPSGRAQREGVSEIIGPSLLRMCKTMGWRATDANLQIARDPRLRTLPGRLFFAKMLEEEDYLGLMDWAKTLHRFHRAIDAPPQYPKAATLLADGGSGFDMGQEAVRAATEAYMAALGVLEAVRGRSAVDWAFSVEDLVSPRDVSRVRLGELRISGEAMAGHFGWK